VGAAAARRATRAVSRRLVVANRGEIARRILRAARARGLEVAVVSTADDSGSRVRHEADAVLEVPDFLDAGAIVAAARAWRADLLHPGYGFLAENAAFADAVEAAGIAFVGPRGDSMRALGDKQSAKALARRVGVPTLEAVPAAELRARPPAEWAGVLAARGIVAPYLVKASAGGGGRGMREVADAAALPAALERAAEEARAGFGDDTVFVERLLRPARHVEIQVFGDGAGGGVSLGERECSLQRRHQKVLEESPSPAVDEALRGRMSLAALALVRETRYRGAGTVEFLLDPQVGFHFLEVNTRLQVEHPVTEMVHGVDLVDAQLELAEGRFPAALGDPATFALPRPRGVALEARVLAEDPRHGFLPTPGRLRVHREPAGEGVRVDSGVGEGDAIVGRYDSLIAKLIVHGPDRATAFARLAAALEGFVVLGCVTNLPFLAALARHPDVLVGAVSTDWIAAHLEALNASPLPASLRALLESTRFRAALADALRGTLAPAHGPAARFAALAAPGLAPGGDAPAAFRLERTADPARLRLSGPALTAAGADALELWACRADGAHLDVALPGDALRLADPSASLAAHRAGTGSLDGTVRAPMAGTVIEIRAAAGDEVEEGQVLFVVESMKMQLEVAAPFAGRVAAVHVARGQALPGPEPMAEVEERAAAPDAGGATAG
jgi:acetyl/propionyl-CoA carboxylase alpha subunit